MSLAEEYDAGTRVEKSKEKKDALRKKTADMGSRNAQDLVAIHLSDDGKMASQQMLCTAQNLQ